MQYFTALGFDTGYSAEEVTRVDAIANAGLEHSLQSTLAVGRALPYVAKSPWYGNRLGDYLERGELDVHAFVLPVRDLGAAAESRRRVSRAAEDAGRDTRMQPGGLTRDDARPGRQERQLAMGFHRLVHTLVEHHVAIHFLPFPAFARSADVLWSRLGGLLAEHGVTRAEADAAFADVVDVDLIHEFDDVPPA